MPLLHLLPTMLALLVLGAHFYRDGLTPLVPVCVGLLMLAWVRLAWVRGVLTGALLLAAAEWLRTLAVLAGDRLSAGKPYLRLVVILVLVMLFTLFAAWLLRATAVRRWYRG